MRFNFVIFSSGRPGFLTRGAIIMFRRRAKAFCRQLNEKLQDRKKIKTQSGRANQMFR